MKPHVMLVFEMRYEECTAMLKGIVHYERSHRMWETFHDDEGRAQFDPHWLRSRSWNGIISRLSRARKKLESILKEEGGLSQ